MTAPSLRILVVGATGSIGKLVIEEARAEGHDVLALARNTASARRLPADTKIVIGDLTRPETLRDALKGIDAIVFTHGSDASDKAVVEAVDYGGVRNVLASIPDGVRPRIALMTAIGVTDRQGSYNRRTEAHDWKRRGERLVRASGLDYTIVRPGWFDYNAPDQLKPVFLQGDLRHAGTPQDGVISRRQIARVLVRSLVSAEANRKTFELVAENGAEPLSFESQFAALQADPRDGIDGVRDTQNMPRDAEPSRVLEDLKRRDAR